MMKNIVYISTSLLLAATGANASDLKVNMFEATPDGPGKQVGSVMISSHGGAGAVFSVQLTGMAPSSVHGFHVHTYGDCGPKSKNGKPVPALMAGGHWDPEGTGKHEGPEGHGHLGDLPPVEADTHGTFTGLITVPRIHDLAQLRGHALMVHADGDNFADQPRKLGGGGARMFCGVIE